MNCKELFQEDAHLSQARVSVDVVFDKVTTRNAQVGLALSRGRATKARSERP